MIERVITGGQTGADQAGWRAARRFGLATGGWMPRGFLTEDGPRSDFATLYGAKEHGSGKYPPRARANVALADALLWFGEARSPGGRLTIDAACGANLPIFSIPEGPDEPALIDWLLGIGIHEGGAPILVLMVAGNRESKSPGIGAWVESFLSVVFRDFGLEERS